MNQLKVYYRSIKNKITNCLDGLSQNLSKSDIDIFAELVFCLLTPQSKAKMCWSAVENLKKKNLLLKGKYEDVLAQLNGVRFKYKKARYIIEARNFFLKKNDLNIKQIILQFQDINELRDYLVKNIKGLGYKEASHFLRNIGLGNNLAILDRHILKNLKNTKVIKTIPNSLTKNKYLEIENNMRIFANKIKIPLSHLDLLFWCKETGEVFK